MKKKYLSALLFGAMTVVSTGTFTSCSDYDDELDGLQEQIDQVKGVMDQLQTAVQSGATIKNVTNTAAGVTVELSNGKTFELSNGVDGKDGKPGTVWEITEDGYWACNGEKTTIKAKGEKGDKGDAGEGAGTTVYYEPGTEGAEKGFFVKVTIKDGKEVREVTTNKWDNGNGGVVAIYEDGTLKLQNVAGTNGETIEVNGYLQSLVFIPEGFTIEGHHAMEYRYTPYLQLTSHDNTYTNTLVTWGTDPSCAEEQKDQLYAIEDKAYTEDETKPYFLNPVNYKAYHQNPSSVIEKDIYKGSDGVLTSSDDVDLHIIHVTKGAQYDWNDLSGNLSAAKPNAKYARIKDGDMILGYTMYGQNVATQAPNPRYGVKESATDKMTIVSPAVKVSDDTYVNATYAAVEASQFYVDALAYHKAYGTDTKKCVLTTDEFQFASEKQHWIDAFGANCGLVNYANHKEPSAEGFHLYDAIPETAEGPATVELIYNDKKGIDLDQLIEVHMSSNSTLKWNNQDIHVKNSIETLDSLGLKLEYSLPKFVIGSNATRQDVHAYIHKEDNGHHVLYCTQFTGEGDNVKADPSTLGNGGTGAIGKTPIVKVLLKDKYSDKIIKVGYIKVKIAAPSDPRWVGEFIFQNPMYRSCAEYVSDKIAWEKIEHEIIEKASEYGINTKDMFDNHYTVAGYGSDGLIVPTGDDLEPEGEAAQFLTKEEKDKYGNIAYTKIGVDDLKHVGRIIKLHNYGGETNFTFEWRFGQEDLEYIYNHANKEDGIKGTWPIYTISRVVKYVPTAGNDGDNGFAKQPLYLTLTAEVRFPEGVVSNKFMAHWFMENSDKTYGGEDEKRTWIHEYVDAPNTVIQGRKAEFEKPQLKLDLNSVFKSNEEGIGYAIDEASKWPQVAWVGSATWEKENAPIIKLDNSKYNWINDKNFADFKQNRLVYYYYFTAENNNVPVQLADKELNSLNGGHKLVVVNKKNNEKVMNITDSGYEFNNTAIYLDNTNPTNLVATIDHKAIERDATLKGEDVNVRPDGNTYAAYLEVAQTNAAKLVLNAPEKHDNVASESDMLKQSLKLKVGIAAFNGCGQSLPLKNNEFNVNVLKPVYPTFTGQMKFQDAEDGVQRQYLYDVIKFTDWRDREFKGQYLFYYNYYGVESMTVDVENILIDYGYGDEVLGSVTKDMVFNFVPGKMVDAAGNVVPAQGVPQLDAQGKFNIDPDKNINQLRDHFGYLTYNGNNASIKTFEFAIPVQIKHYWSHETETVWVRGNVVDGTINNVVK